MELNKYNNLLELFNFQYNRQNPSDIFLKSLKNPENIFTWQQAYDCIQKLSNELNLIIEEKRPLIGNQANNLDASRFSRSSTCK